jgi:hypothetical protein
MADAPAPSARLMEARARIAAFTERLVLENIAADCRRGREPTTNINQLLELQAFKRRLGIRPSKSD